jgi:hypothetical protein
MVILWKLIYPESERYVQCSLFILHRWEWPSDQKRSLDMATKISLEEAKQRALEFMHKGHH